MNEKKDINQIKAEYKAQMEKNKKISRIIKFIIYILAGLLLALFGSFFVVRVILEHTNIYFYEELCVPIGIVIFGIIAILLTRLNGKVSTTNDTTGDRLVLVIGIIMAIGGVALMIYNIISH